MPRIICSNSDHEGRVIQLSPDYRPVSHRAFLARSGWVKYHIDGDIVDAYLLSCDFAEKFRIDFGLFEAGDTFPEWCELTVLECRQCFEERK
jgi:hypothetical protein